MAQGLGRGLRSLIPPKTNQFAVAAEQAASSPEIRAEASVVVQDLPLTAITPNPLQPRQHFDERSLDELAASIDQYGLLEPVVVVQEGTGWQLVAGERRLRAFQKLKRQTIPAIVRTATELERLELAIIENVQREDLNPIEKANSYAKLVNEFGLTQAQAALKIGIARSSLANAIRLLDLPTEIQVAVAEHKITEGHAKVLLGLDSAQEQMAYFTRLISGKTSSVRELSEAVQHGTKKSSKRSVVDHELAQLAERIESALGTKVSVLKKGNGHFQIIVEAFSSEQLKAVVKKIG